MIKMEKEIADAKLNKMKAHERLMQNSVSRNPIEQRKKIKVQIDKLLCNKYQTMEFMNHFRSLKLKKLREEIQLANKNYLKENRLDA